MEAQFKLGEIYLLKRTPEYNKKAVELFRKAAEQGYNPAYTPLAQIYFAGKEGVPRDRAEAVFWNAASNYWYHRDFDITQYPYRELSSDVEKAQAESRFRKWLPNHRAAEAINWKDKFLNIDGMLCGGESNGCKMISACGNLIAAHCIDNENFFSFTDSLAFISKESKKLVTRCYLFKDKLECKSDKLAEWTCDWPHISQTQRHLLTDEECKGAPSDEEYESAFLEKRDAKTPRKSRVNIFGLACNKSQTATVLAACGDLIWIDEEPDRPLDSPRGEMSFANFRTKKMLEENELRKDGVPREWTCDFPPYRPNHPQSESDIVR